MSSQTTNNYLTASISPNIDEARIMKAEQDDQTRLYHKMLKGLEAMIDVQR